MNKPQHISVLPQEVLEYLKPFSQSRLLDLTLGLGGHTGNYLAASPTSTAVGLDADPGAAQEAARRLQSVADRLQILVGNFANITTTLADHKVTGGFDHILLDLGIGSHQLQDQSRGFSFQSSAPLNMLFGTSYMLPPSDIDTLNVLEKRLGRLPDVIDILQYLAEADLAHLIRYYGEERYARRIAAAITRARPITTTGELVAIIQDNVPAAYRHGRIHPATRTFQALRIAVNRELEAIKATLPQALELLKPSGYLAVISFHSLEDRIVKHYFREQAKDCICPQEQPICTCSHPKKLDIITNKPIRPNEVEIKQNPRSRSAKLRVAQKIP